MLNLEKMFVLIAARPQIRTVEIADIIDCDPDQVQPALQSNIDLGYLAVTEVTAPNGRPANAFTITRKFMCGDLYPKLQADIAAQRAADEQVRPSPAPAPKPAAAPRSLEQSMTAPGVERIAAVRVLPPEDDEMPVFTTGQAPPRAPRSATGIPVSKIDVAIRFVRESGGRVSHAGMKAHLGITQHQSPVAWLGSALRDGRLARDGTDWLIGNGTPPTPAATPAVAEPLRQAAPTQAPAPAVATPPAPEPKVAEPAPLALAVSVDRAPPRFRWAAWSDGSIEIERDGQKVLTLSPDECVALAPAMVRTTMEVAQ